MVCIFWQCADIMKFTVPTAFYCSADTKREALEEIEEWESETIA